jgi:hypothetical protein
LDTSVLISASIATVVLVGVLFLAVFLLRSMRRAMGGDESSGPREGPSLEAIYAEWMAKQATPEASAAREAVRAGAEDARGQLRDAEGLLAQLRRDAGAAAGEDLLRAIGEAETELRGIRACLNRGEASEARERAQSLTLRLATEIARRGASE